MARPVFEIYQQLLWQSVAILNADTDFQARYVDAEYVTDRMPRSSDISACVRTTDNPIDVANRVKACMRGHPVIADCGQLTLYAHSNGISLVGLTAISVSASQTYQSALKCFTKNYGQRMQAWYGWPIVGLRLMPIAVMDSPMQLAADLLSVANQLNNAAQCRTRVTYELKGRIVHIQLRQHPKQPKAAPDNALQDELVSGVDQLTV
jgi:hypothetical protein